MTHDLAGAIDQARKDRRWMRVVCVVAVAALLLVAVMFGLLDGLQADRDADSTRLAEVEAEAEAGADLYAQAASDIEALREQIQRCAHEPPGSAGCTEPVVPQPTALPAIPPSGEPDESDPAEVPAWVVRAAARDAVAAALPDATDGLRSELDRAVADAVAACVAAGPCAGQTVPVEQVTALVVEAVADYCASGACQGPAGPTGEPGPPGEPGGGLTAEQAAELFAELFPRWIAEWAPRQAVWCPRDTANDDVTQPIGPCLIGSG